MRLAILKPRDGGKTTTSNPIFVVKPGLTEDFVKLMADARVRLPLRMSEVEVGSIVDADGREVCVVRREPRAAGRRSPPDRELDRRGGEYLRLASGRCVPRETTF